MPEIEGLSDQIYEQMGVDPNKVSDEMHDTVVDMVETKSKQLWFGLIEQWIPYREYHYDATKRDQVLKSFNFKVEEGQKIETEDNMNFYRTLSHSREENPFKLRNFFLHKLQND